MLYTDVQIIIQEIDNDCQKLIYLLGKLASKYNISISTVKTNAMPCRGKDPVISKIVINLSLIHI